MKRKTDAPATANHQSMVALLIRLGADPDEAYNATEAMTSEAKRVALELVEGLKLQILSRIEVLHVALKGFKAEVEARFEGVDQRFDAMPSTSASMPSTVASSRLNARCERASRPSIGASMEWNGGSTGCKPSSMAISQAIGNCYFCLSYPLP